MSEEVPKTQTTEPNEVGRTVNKVDDVSPNENKQQLKVNSTFPLAIFPQEIQEIITELVRDRLYPLEYVGSAVLFVLSVLIGASSYLLTILGKTYANIYVAIVGDQGTNKSTPIAWALAPLLEEQHSQILKYNQVIHEWDEQMKKYRSTKNTADDPGPRPVCPRLICSDTTPEALLKILSFSPKGLGHYEDELTRLISGFGRYQKDSNDDLLLQLFSGQSITIDRATHDETLSIYNPFYSLIGTIQPKRLIKMMTKDGRYESGFFSRFLLAIHLDNSAMMWRLNEDLPSDVDDRYCRIINAFITHRSRSNVKVPTMYKLSEDAAAEIEQWQNNRENIIEETGMDSDRAIFRKLQIYVLRFSLLIQITWDICDGKDNPDHIISVCCASKDSH